MSTVEDKEIVEYWEAERLPSMQKTSEGFRDALQKNYNPQRLHEIFCHPFLPREEIKRLQFERIKELIQIAYNKVPFYRNKYDQAGIKPEDIQSWDDYYRLPLVNKDELMEAFPDQCVNTDFQHDDLFPTRSSGSSGKTLKIFVDPEAIITDTLQGIRQLWLQTAGEYNEGHTVANVYTVPWWVDHLSQDAYQNIFISSLISPDKIGEILAEVRPDVLSLYPSNLASILPFLPQEVKDQILVAITHSEMSSKQEREEFSRQLGKPVLDEYSSEELTRIALELPDNRYYLCEDSVSLDVLDQETLLPIDKGTGIAVATNLLNEAMPFIRYVQGDHITVGDQYDSPIHWRQIEKVDGRLNDSFIREDGESVPAGTILDITYRWMFDVGINIQEFEVLQESLGQVTVNVHEPKLVGKEDLIAKSSGHLTELLRYVLGQNIEVSFNLVDHIEKNGKKRRPIRRNF